MLSNLVSPDTGRRANRVSAFAAARLAYEIAFDLIWPMLRVLLPPMIAGGLVLYLSLSAYLSGLLLFLETQNPQVASLALGSLAAGIFLFLFCCAVAVSAISKLALGKELKGTWSFLRADRQTWRLYAAYLRFLLLVATAILVAYVLGAIVGPLLAVSQPLAAWLLIISVTAGIAWLMARIGFLIAPVVAGSKGAILRRGLKESAFDFWRNVSLVVLLLAPAFVVQMVGEFFLRRGLAPPRLSGTVALANHAQAMEQMLAGFLFVVCLSSFVTLALITLGGMAAYHPGHLRDAQRRRREAL